MAVIAPYKAGGFSDPGRRRDNNEDRFHFDAERGIFFVIDGVGGQAAGEKAADIAYNELRARLERTIGTVDERIREAITLANNEIHQLAHSNTEWSGMACVLTVAVVEEGNLTIGHVGDSRLYVIRNGEIKKLTHDHSPVGEREDRGEIDEFTAMRHPRRNEVFRDVGSEEHGPDDPDFIELIQTSFPSDAALLLCSDGLSDLVTASQILTIVEAYAGDPNATSRALIDAANEAGGKDNITVVVVEAPQFSPAAAKPKATPAYRSAPAPPAPTVSRRPPVLSFLLGLLLTLAAVWLLKPHWRITEAGTLFGFGAVREPRTWRVAGDIESAINNASAGDVIIVAPGIYPEQLRLKSGVSIISEQPREAVLQTYGVAVTADNVRSARIQGFRIVSDEGQPLTVGLRVNDSDLEAADMEISGAQTAGIEILGSSTGALRASSVVANPGTGIVIRDNAKPRLVHNVIAENGRGPGTGRPGIEVAGGAQPSISANTIFSNAAEQIWAPQLNVESLLRQNFVTSRQAAKPPAAAKPRSPR